MNTKLLEFLRGTGTDTKGRFLAQILTWDDERWEGCHDHVQVVFPSRQPSQFNAAAPLLDDETVQAILADPIILGNIRFAFKRFVLFLGIAKLYPEQQLHWVNPGDHNYLRITRVFLLIRELGFEVELEFFWQQMSWLFLRNPDLIGATTFQYWQEAAGKAQPNTNGVTTG